MAYARVQISEHPTLELGLDNLDDPAHLDHLVRAMALLWRVAITDEESS